MNEYQTVVKNIKPNNHKRSAVRGIAALLFLLASYPITAQDLSGYWEGKIALSKRDSLTIGIQIDYRADTLYIELDSPDQYFTGQPASDIQFEDSVLTFRTPEFNLRYEGTLSPDGQWFTGLCTQHGRVFDCTLSRGAQRKQFLRPQTPAPPFPYRTEELSIRSRDGKRSLIHGTLTLPVGTPKGFVVFISGSGWQDRDETIFAHKPFAVIADTLTKAGFATFRYDDFPTIIFRKSTTFDFADAVRLVLDSLLQRDELQHLTVGLIGHSEGSLVASIVASDDPRIGFTIHLGGVAQPIEEILLYQSTALNNASNILSEKEIENSIAINRQFYDVIKKSKSQEECADKIGALWDKLSSQLTEDERTRYNMTPESKFTMIQTMTSPWYYELFRIDPKKYIRRIKTPMLAISGDLDMQVCAYCTMENFTKYLKDKTLLTSFVLNGLNHLLQPCTTGTPAEYGVIETTVSPDALKILVEWADKHALRPNGRH